MAGIFETGDGRALVVVPHWRTVCVDAGSFLLRCLVGAVHLGRYAGLFGLARVKGRPLISGGGRIAIGSRFVLVNKIMPCEIFCAPGARITIGSGVQVNYGVLIAARERITIGDNVLVGNLSVISDTAFPTRPDAIALEDDPPQPIEIGDDVWLAARVTIMPGAKIGRGAVIGAGSVVRGTIPPGVMAMGNPARPLMRVGVRDAPPAVAGG